MSIFERVARRLYHSSRRQLVAVTPTYFKLHGNLAGRWRSNAKTIVQSSAGDDPNRTSARVAVFVHYDSRGHVHDYIISHLRGLNEAGLRIWFMSNTPRLGDDAIARLKPHVAWIHRRNNFGYDFGAYKDGILSVMAALPAEQIVLCNDSVYGPLQPLAPILERANPDVADVWGMTEGFEYRYHLQSYFIAFNRRAIQAPKFAQFWREVPYVDARGWLIHHGEVGLTQTLLGSGLRVRSLFPMDEIVAKLEARLAAMPKDDDETDGLSPVERSQREFQRGLAGAVDGGQPLNPTHFFWDVLIEDCGFPYIKRDLLQLNPAQVPGLSRWSRVVGKVSRYDVGEIRAHLTPRMRNRIV